MVGIVERYEDLGAVPVRRRFGVRCLLNNRIAGRVQHKQRPMQRMDSLGPEAGRLRRSGNSHRNVNSDPKGYIGLSVGLDESQPLPKWRVTCVCRFEGRAERHRHTRIGNAVCSGQNACATERMPDEERWRPCSLALTVGRRD